MSRLAALLALVAVHVANPAHAQQLALWAQVSENGPRPGDIVRVRIWREAELSGDFLVGENGEVVLPLLGAIATTGKTAELLIDELTAKYGQYLRNPSIEIMVLRRISVQGEVRSPGLYPVDATVSLADAVALAGGLTPTADARRISLVRQGEVLDVQLSPETVIQRSPVLSGDQILVGQKSWLSRNSGILIGAGITAAAIITAALVTNN